MRFPFSLHRKRIDYCGQARELQTALNDVYAAHGITDPQRIPVVYNNPIYECYGALEFCNKTVELHYGHEVCDAELFQLDWLVHLFTAERKAA